MRKLTLFDGVWLWHCGKSGVWLIAPDGVRRYVKFDALLEMSWTDIERAKWKGYFSVTPKNVRNYIERVPLDVGVA